MAERLTDQQVLALLGTLEKLSEDWDVERAHSKADEVLCSALIALGYDNIVEAWRRVDKYYA